MNWSELTQLLPIGVLLIAAAAVVFFDLILDPKDRYILPWLALGGLILSIGSAVQTQDAAWTRLLWFTAYDARESANFGSTMLLGGAFALDHFGLLIWLIACGTGALCLLYGSSRSEESALSSGEYHGLLLLAVAGMMLLAVSHDFLTLLLSLEIMSISTYILTGSERHRISSTEAALKYLVLGAFSTAFLLLGVAFCFGAFGTLSLSPSAAFAALRQANPAEADSRMMFAFIGLALLLVGTLFKAGAVPFHFWIPDVYQGAPAPVTGLMAAGVKAAAFAVIARLAFETFGQPGFRQLWTPLIEIISILTMVLGNVLAMRQSSVKRMLAYSGIAHTGYLLLALLLNEQAASAVMGEHLKAVVFYLAVYGVMTVGAFGVVSLTRRDGQSLDEMDSYRGLAKQNPGLAFCMAVFLTSLAGLPPAAGFFAKFMIFRDAVSQGFVTAAVVGVLASVASLYYYLRPVVAMYMSPAAEEGAEAKPAEYLESWGSNLLVYGTGLATLVMGVLPGLIVRLWPN